MLTAQKTEERFWSKVTRGKDHECWLWKGSLNKQGYGLFSVGRARIGAHRFSWRLTRKCRVPEGKWILHICDNPTCVNPHHLYCGDACDNVADRVERNPYANQFSSKLSADDVCYIRSLKGWEAVREASVKFDVTPSTICRCRRLKFYFTKEETWV